MRILLLLLFPFFASATGYYVAANGNDANAGTTETTPWKTLIKVNNSVYVSGDQVQFRRGDTWYGSLAAKNGVTYTAYGTGNNPIITGLYTVTSWTATANGLYEAIIPANLASCNSVIVDGHYQPMGRYPRSGYITATGGSTSAVTGPLTGVPSFVGGEIVWRPYHWVLWRGAVTAQTTGQVNFTAFPATSGGAVYPAKAGYGFFFQNSPAACTSPGDWSYAAGKLTMFFGATGPAGHVVQVSSVETIVAANGGNPAFSGLTIAGGNTNGFNLNNVNKATITGCEVLYSGVYGINANSASINCSVTGCNIQWSGSNAIGNAQGLQGWVITGNTILNTGSVAGMGGSGEGQYFGIINVKQGRVEGNTIRNIGYNAICFQGTSNSIKNNFIDTFCTVKDDGSAIYAGGQNYSGTIIEGNITLHGLGAAIGTPDNDGRTHGVYIDDKGNNVEIRGNTFAYNDGAGINLHDAFGCNIHDNICFDNKKASIVYYNDGNTIAGISLNKNIFFAVNGSQMVHRSSGGTTSSASFFTAADNNYWCRPVNENANFSSSVPLRTDNLTTWKTFTGKETSSKITPAGGSGAILIYNETDAARIIPSGYVDLFYGATSILAHSSMIVIPGAVTPPPVFMNITVSKAYTKNNCTSGTGTTVTYIVVAGKYSASTQPAADQLAQNDITANGQNYANMNGTCVPKTIIKIVIYYSDGSTTTQQ
jgi:parallel beta-helix repeat protein